MDRRRLSHSAIAIDALDTDTGEAPRTATHAESLSETISVARVICILGIVYVHAWTGLNVDELRAQGGSWHSLLYWTLIELFGRSAVPLLSIISGWLVMASVTRRSYGRFVGGKAKSLLLPMILWNLVTVALVVGFAYFGELKAPQPGPGMPLLNEVLHLSAPGEINVQNAFLRDVFICMLAAPLLVRLPTAALGLVLAATLAWCIEGWQIYLLLRPQILLFFLIGMFAFRFRADGVVARVPMTPLVLLFVTLGAGKVWLSVAGQHHQTSYPEAVAAADNLLRIIAAMVFWKLSAALARGGLSSTIRRFDRYSFMLFCSHVLLIWLLAPVIGPLFGRFGEPGYPLFLLLQPLLALTGTVLVGRLLLRTSPSLAGILSGGRLSVRDIRRN